MKYIKSFQTLAEYQAAQATLETPNVVLIKDEMENENGGVVVNEYVPPTPVIPYDYSALENGQYAYLFDGAEFSFYATFDSTGTDQDGWVEPFVSKSTDAEPQAFAAWNSNLFANYQSSSMLDDGLFMWLYEASNYNQGNVSIYIYGDDDLTNPLNDGTFYYQDQDSDSHNRLSFFLNDGDFYIAVGDNYVECSNPSATIHKYTIKVVINSLSGNYLERYGMQLDGYRYDIVQEGEPLSAVIPTEGALVYYGYKNGQYFSEFPDGKDFYNQVFFPYYFENSTQFILEGYKRVNNEWVSATVSVGTESSVDGNEIMDYDGEGHYFSFTINGEYKLGFDGNYLYNNGYQECPSGALYKMVIKVNPNATNN